MITSVAITTTTPSTITYADAATITTNSTNSITSIIDNGSRWSTYICKRNENIDGCMDVGNERIKIKEMSDILASRFAFITGARTKEGNPILIFPDSRTQLAEEEFHLLISYLLQIPSGAKSYVIIIDRRMDKWSSIRLLLAYLTRNERRMNERRERMNERNG
ncbi:Dbl-likey (DH) domain and CRAL-TRIO domain and Pleckstrin-likey-like domain-containing protein [Dirofilaria immitis]|nr:Dbl-likey (DH) domain and CRAL-TRIO domain and Pleckstrin-likey-like domain-containing protein [Dirofilaria immitis]